MSNPADSTVQNLLPVQAYFDVYGNFQTFIGQSKPFYATVNPVQSGLTITNSTINSSVIGGSVPAAGYFTSIATTSGTVANAPSANTDIANKLYVDTVAQGLGPKAACKCGTTVNITLSGLQTIDGYTTLAGDRVLVKNQTSSQFNGIYIASASTWTRATDMDVWSEVPGAYTILLNGTQTQTGWVCTAASTGTIDVTAMPWVQFSVVNTYFAGTGLTLASNTFSITNVGTAGTYGSASSVPVFVTNAQGQVTGVTNTPIAIANTAVSGLGTMSTQNANAVAITGGSIDGASVGTTTASTVRGTTITATTQFTGAGTGLTGTATSLSIGGNAATATSATSAGSVTNSVTFNTSGSGGASPITYNGSVAQTISYNTIGAPSTTGTGASGTWGISISGNAATATSAGSSTTATTATNLAGGATGSVPYQSGAGATTFLTAGTSGQVLSTTGSAVQWIGPSPFLDNITTTQGSIIYRNSVGWVSLPPSTAGYLLQTGGVAANPSWLAQSSVSAGSATNATNSTYLAGGVAGAIPWQSAIGVTGFTAAGSTGQVLTSNGTTVPTWTTPTAYATVTDDTTTAAVRYPLFANQTSGNISTEYTSSTKLQYNPNTGVFTSTSFTGAGTGLTGTASSLSIGGTSANVTGTVAIGNGGTGQTTASAAFNALSPITTIGDLIIGNGTNSATRLAIGTSTYVLTSNGTTATWSAPPVTGVTITDDTSSVTAYYPLFARITTGTASTEYTSSTKLNYTPSSGLLAATSFSGSGSSLTFGTGTLSLAGNVTYSGAFTQTWTRTANTSLTLPTSGTLISTVTNMAANPVTGTPSATTFLRGDGTWATPLGAGTVTSVAQSFTGGLISVTGSPITGSGTLALTVAGTSGGIPYFSSASTWASSALLTLNGVMYGGGAGASPVATAAGTTGQVLIATTSAAPSWGQVSLTAGVTGTLPTANGGTNLTSFTANGVVYASSTSALATGSVLLFDGTNLGVGVTPTARLDLLNTTTGVGAYNIIARSAQGGYGAGISLQSPLGVSGVLTEMGRITADGDNSWSSTLGTQFASLRFRATNNGTPNEVFRIGPYGNLGVGSGTLSYGTSGQVLTSGGTSGAASWATLSGVAVTSFSAGTTGFTPNTATTGAVTLAGTLVIANGGTNSTATPTAGGAVYGTGTAYAITAVGTAGQVLTSNGASAPTWTTITSGVVAPLTVNIQQNYGGF